MVEAIDPNDLFFLFTIDNPPCPLAKGDLLKSGFAAGFCKFYPAEEIQGL